jgi:hypothetical protein
MADSAFWRELAATNLLVPGHETIRVDLQYAIGSKVWQWRLSGSGNPNESDRYFKHLAGQGAYEIAPKGTTDLVFFWLEAIMKERINFHEIEVPQYVVGTIERVFEASAKLCGILEERAMQAEFDEKHRNDSRTLRQTSPAIDDPVRVMMRHKTEMALREIERQRELEHERRLAELRASTNISRADHHNLSPHWSQEKKYPVESSSPRYWTRRAGRRWIGHSKRK